MPHRPAQVSLIRSSSTDVTDNTTQLAADSGGVLRGYLVQLRPFVKRRLLEEVHQFYVRWIPTCFARDAICVLDTAFLQTYSFSCFMTVSLC